MTAQWFHSLKLQGASITRKRDILECMLIWNVLIEAVFTCKLLLAFETSILLHLLLQLQMPSEAVPRFESDRAAVTFWLTFQLVVGLTVQVEIILPCEHNLAVIALVCRWFLLHLVIGRHVTEKLAVLCEFQTTKLASVDVLWFAVISFYSCRARYPDPRAGSGRFLTHCETRDRGYLVITVPSLCTSFCNVFLSPTRRHFVKSGFEGEGHCFCRVETEKLSFPEFYCCLHCSAQNNL